MIPNWFKKDKKDKKIDQKSPTSEIICDWSEIEISLICNCECIHDRYHGLVSPSDSELTVFGRKQARKIKGIFDLIILSPLKRSVQTLIQSQLAGYQVEISELCREYIRDPCDFLEHEVSSLENKEYYQTS